MYIAVAIAILFAGIAYYFLYRWMREQENRLFYERENEQLAKAYSRQRNETLELIKEMEALQALADRHKVKAASQPRVKGRFVKKENQ